MTLWTVSVKQSLLERVDCLIEADDEAQARAKYKAGDYYTENDTVLEEIVVQQDILAVSKCVEDEDEDEDEEIGDEEIGDEEIGDEEIGV